MTTATTERVAGVETAPQVAPAAQLPETSTVTRTFLGITRLSLGFVFMWAFLDKTFGLGFATERADAWINGGSATFGFLAHGTTGPFATMFQSIAGATWADWLFMVGLLGIGTALLLGIGMRIAAASGALLLMLMWAAALPLENNPVIDDHVVYAIVLGLLAAAHAGRHLGLGARWERTALVRRFPILA